jgi:RNA polymerase sigma-70 factor (ECF subfamily)
MDLEGRIAGLLAAADLRGAATLSIEGYGPEVLGFLVTLFGNESDASEAFGQASEDLWAGLGRFQGRCSLRTWFYTLARNAAARLQRSPERRAARRKVSLGFVADVAERVRSQTLPHLRTDIKDRVASIRDALPEEDRALLVLRVDREMSWSDVARIHAGDDASEEELARVAARLRKRFQSIKEEIRRRAKQSGLLPDDEP